MYFSVQGKGGEEIQKKSQKGILEMPEYLL